MNGSVDGLIVIAAVSVSYRNACAYGKADKEVDDKVCYRTGSTDCRDGNTAALKSSCRTLVKIIGIVYLTIFQKSGPRSIELLLFILLVLVSSTAGVL